MDASRAHLWPIGPVWALRPRAADGWFVVGLIGEVEGGDGLGEDRLRDLDGEAHDFALVVVGDAAKVIDEHVELVGDALVRRLEIGARRATVLFRQMNERDLDWHPGQLDCVVPVSISTPVGLPGPVRIVHHVVPSARRLRLRQDWLATLALCEAAKARPPP